MSTLQQSLNQRRAAEVPLQCVSVAPTPVPVLIVRSWQGETWLLPWSHFVSARLNEEADQLEIAFTHCVLHATGEKLDRLVEDFAAFRIGVLRDLPSSYRKKAAEEEPFISRIEVRVAQDAAAAVRAPS